MNPLLADLLFRIRGHEGFPELLKHIPRPRIQPFKVTEAEKTETQRARFIYQSGQDAQHQAWLNFLTGNATSQNGD